MGASDAVDGVLRKGCKGMVGEGRNMRASLLDTRGPEIRTLKIENDTTGKETLTLTKGEQVGVESDVTGEKECTPGKFYVNYAGIEKVRGGGKGVLLPVNLN
jgi:pyruvate kinase